MYKRSANVSAGHGGPEQPPGGRNCHLLMWALSFLLHTTSGGEAGRAGILLQSISSTSAKAVLSAETAEQHQLQHAKAFNEGKYDSGQGEV